MLAAQNQFDSLPVREGILCIIVKLLKNRLYGAVRSELPDILPVELKNGKIGIIGPRRMNYEKVVDSLKNLMTELDGIFDDKKRD